MPDDPPISTTVPETVTVNTGADKESLGDINTEFADFWKTEDAKQEGAPAAPGEGAAQETKAETLKPKAEEPAPKAETPLAKEVTDEEIDKMETPAHWRPEVVEQVKNLKDLWKADRAKAKTEAERAAKLEQDLEQARANAWTPEAKSDYEHAAAIRRKFDFVSDPEFIQKFHAPVRSQFEAILGEAAQVLPDPQAGQAWAQYIAQNYQPDQLDRNWWLNSVIAKIPNEMDRASVLQSVTQLLKIQRERDTEITRRTNDKSAYDNWVTERDQANGQLLRDSIMAEIGIQEKRFEGLLHQDPDKAKTPEERRAIEEHNEYFTKINNHFQEVLLDLDKNNKDIKNRGRAWVRAAVQAGMAFHLDNQNKRLESELKSAKAERDQLKNELDKISGARRKISQTTGTPPSSGAKKQTGDGLSVKNLDVRESFKNFDWGDGT